MIDKYTNNTTTNCQDVSIWFKLHQSMVIKKENEESQTNGNIFTMLNSSGVHLLLVHPLNQLLLNCLECNSYVRQLHMFGVKIRFVNFDKQDFMQEELIYTCCLANLLWINKPLNRSKLSLDVLSFCI